MELNSKSEIIFKELGNYLRERRVASGLSQMEVSKALGYSTSQFLSNCERGVSTLPLEKLGELVKIYKLNRKELINFILDTQKTYLEAQLKAPPFRRRKNRRAS